jgi:hypothetical protein
MSAEENQWRGVYPRGAVEKAIVALEAARPDTKDNGAVREIVDEALDLLYRAQSHNAEDSACEPTPTKEERDERGQRCAGVERG